MITKGGEVVDIAKLAHELSLVYAKVKFEKELCSPDYEMPSANDGEVNNLVSNYCFAYGVISNLNAEYIKELIER